MFNCTPVPRYEYRVGVPFAGRWKELLNSDSETFGGSGLGNLGAVDVEGFPCHGRDGLGAPHAAAALGVVLRAGVTAGAQSQRTPTNARSASGFMWALALPSQPPVTSSPIERRCAPPSARS